MKSFNELPREIQERRTITYAGELDRKAGRMALLTEMADPTKGGYVPTDVSYKASRVSAGVAQAAEAKQAAEMGRKIPVEFMNAPTQNVAVRVES